MMTSDNELQIMADAIGKAISEYFVAAMKAQQQEDVAAKMPKSETFYFGRYDTCIGIYDKYHVYMTIRDTDRNVIYPMTLKLNCDQLDILLTGLQKLRDAIEQQQQ